MHAIKKAPRQDSIRLVIIKNQLVTGYIKRNLLRLVMYFRLRF